MVADVAGWRAPRNRIAGLPTPIGLVPQWICEVLDPSTRTLDLTHKRRAYAEAGVESLWMVDPMARVLEVFANEGGRWVLTLAVSEDEVAAPPFKRLRFDVSDLWLPLAPRASQLPPPMSQKRKSRSAKRRGGGRGLTPRLMNGASGGAKRSKRTQRGRAPEERRGESCQRPELIVQAPPDVGKMPHSGEKPPRGSKSQAPDSGRAGRSRRFRRFVRA